MMRRTNSRVHCSPWRSSVDATVAAGLIRVLEDLPDQQRQKARRCAVVDSGLQRHS
jgi:hypothetical protein